MVADGGMEFVIAVIIAGNRAGAYVNAFTHGCVANVGKVRHLRARTDGGVFDLYMGSRFCVWHEVRSRAQIRTGTAGGAIFNNRGKCNCFINNATIANACVGESRVRPDNAIGSDMR